MLTGIFNLQLKEEIPEDPAKAMAYGEPTKYRKILLGKIEES